MVRLVLTLSLAALCACSDDAKPGLDAPSGSNVGLAVLNSDYSSTSVALMSPTGEITHGVCIDSGTRPPGNTLALSGDVVLPTQAQPDHLLVTIDRTNSALTWIDPSTCTPLRQL